MGEVNVGPTVTQYTFRPAVGVKLAQIISRQADLALALAAPSIRIEAPIPGKSLVGIEVPNATKALVGLRGLLETSAFMDTPANLLFVLGRDVAGHPMMADLAKMPHLLIAGATGAGKSVCINTIMTSFLYRNSPEELRFIVIDPKRVELTLYNGIPHLLTPVVTDHKQAVNALKWMVSEMDQRYRILSEEGRRNIEEYNAGAKEKLPYLVLIVDELADLMSVAKADVETSIVRLAQMARAVGLHLVLATQRPSVNIITGLIKANITSRIAFSVASQVDSRTILDIAGAEDLLGHGDMLYMTASLPKPKRIQAPYMSEKEVRRVVDFLKNQSGPVEYQTDILEKHQSAVGVGGSGLDDSDDVDGDLINAAIEEIRRSRKASASFLQRRLKVGYARAARILDVLEERGLIGPADGAKPREVFIDDTTPPMN
jgi:S-DNA-T family DNA segregation ATPase FtsK/SpoIIIE